MSIRRTTEIVLFTGDDGKTPVGSGYIWILTQESLNRSESLIEGRYNCFAYALRTCDWATGIGYIPDPTCVLRILSCKRMTQMIREPTYATDVQERGEAIKAGDVIVLWHTTKEYAVHGCTLLDAPTFEKGAMSLSTRVLTKNGPVKPTTMTLGDVLHEYNEDTRGETIGPRERKIGIYRVLRDIHSPV